MLDHARLVGLIGYHLRVHHFGLRRSTHLRITIVIVVIVIVVVIVVVVVLVVVSVVVILPSRWALLVPYMHRVGVLQQLRVGLAAGAFALALHTAGAKRQHTTNAGHVSVTRQGTAGVVP